MKTASLTALLLLLLCSFSSRAQMDRYLHESTFGSFKGVMNSKPYKPDPWEKDLFERSRKSVFPYDLVLKPDAYRGQLIHLLGIVDSVSLEKQGDTTTVVFRLDNKYWDYIEDYSIQDEVMFVSPMGGGRFIVQLKAAGLSAEETQAISAFAAEKKLLFVYGTPEGLSEGVPLLTATALKYVAYKYYTTTVFSFDVQRTDKGETKRNNKDAYLPADFKSLRVPGKGQNK